MLGHATAQSASMLTCDQIASDEKSYVVLAAYDEIFQERKYVEDKCNGTYLGYKFKFIDLNDAKIYYSIARHNSKNRSGYHMLKCFCHPTDCSLIEDHQFRIMTQNEFEASKRKSSNKFNKMKEKEDSVWDNAKHRKWADMKNHGVAHFGCDFFLLDSLFFLDTLHATLSVTRQNITFSRNYITTKPYEIQQELTILLKEYWRNYYVDSF